METLIQFSDFFVVCREFLLNRNDFINPAIRLNSSRRFYNLYDVQRNGAHFKILNVILAK